MACWIYFSVFHPTFFTDGFFRTGRLSTGMDMLFHFPFDLKGKDFPFYSSDSHFEFVCNLKRIT